MCNSWSYKSSLTPSSKKLSKSRRTCLLAEEQRLLDAFRALVRKSDLTVIDPDAFTMPSDEMVPMMTTAANYILRQYWCCILGLLRVSNNNCIYCKDTFYQKIKWHKAGNFHCLISQEGRYQLSKLICYVFILSICHFELILTSNPLILISGSSYCLLM